MEFETISKEIIKPSSPTPSHLKIYQLSMLEQVLPSSFVPIVLYFPVTNIFPLSSSHLKNSLSTILTRYYPLAGRVSDDGKSIVCDHDDSGVPFTVVEFRDKSLSDLLQENELFLPPGLVPCVVEILPGTSVLSIQLNYFKCGSLAIGALFWHKAVDAATIGNFLKSWAAVVKGCNDVVSPNYIAQSLLPKNEIISRKIPSEMHETGKASINRYVFDGDKILSLKATFGDRPSRVQIVSAVMWKCFMVASLAHGNNFSVLNQVVNFRGRAKPPFSGECFGNFVGIAPASAVNSNEGADLGVLIKKLRESVGKIDGNYVNKIVGENGVMGYHENMKPIWDEIPEEGDRLLLTSWCGFGFYDVDFGFGSPGWISGIDGRSESDKTRSFNRIWLMDCKKCGGIEAWVTLGQDYMSIFDDCMKLEAFACKNPTPVMFPQV